MINLPKLASADIKNKRVIVRADLDIDPADLNNLRLTSLTPTLDYLKSQNCVITIISHRGRPEGKIDETLSLKPFENYFSKWNAKVLENLRFNPGEESNSEEFAKELAKDQDFFVNESFDTSHREHASIVLDGVTGKCEEEGQSLGTERVFKAVANSKAFKIVGVGDSLVVVAKYNLEKNFNSISFGGGAMLQFLAKRTLPGIIALIQK